MKIWKDRNAHELSLTAEKVASGGDTEKFALIKGRVKIEISLACLRTINNLFCRGPMILGCGHRVGYS